MMLLTMLSRARPALLTILLAVSGLLIADASARPADLDNDIRLRFGGYFPEDLPTDAGIFPGLEWRNLLTKSDGIFVGAYLYSEKRSETQSISGTTFQFEADIEILPLLVGWFHVWQAKQFELVFGAGVGIYEVEAFSGGYSKQAGRRGVQLQFTSEFRPISDDSRAGFAIFGGMDFFPDGRWGIMIESRLHIVEDDLSALEATTGAIVRF
jgi:hypothetical protein